MLEVSRRDDKALFAPMSICRLGLATYTAEGPHGDWRVEVQGCLFDRLSQE